MQYQIIRINHVIAKVLFEAFSLSNCWQQYSESKSIISMLADQPMKINNSKIISAFVCIGLLVVLGGNHQVHGQNREPLTLAQILTGLQTKSNHPSVNTLAKRNNKIAKDVRKFGISFVLIPELEVTLKNVGASKALIETIRAKSPKYTKTETSNGTRDAESYINRGDKLAEKGEYIKAIADYTRAIQLSPEKVGYLLKRGVAYHYMGNSDLAFVDYEAIVSLNPTTASTVFMKCILFDNSKDSWEVGMKSCNQIIDSRSSYSLPYYKRGIIFNAQSKVDEALADYNKAIALNPYFASAYFNRGNIYQNKGNYDRALQDYTKAFELHTDAMFLSSRGAVYVKKKEYETALQDFNHAININPRYARAYNLRGNLFYQQKEYERAIADYTKVTELDRNAAYAYGNRGRVYKDKREYDQAIRDFSEAIEIDPNYSSAYFQRAYCQHEKGNYTKAIRDNTKAIELRPNFADAYNNRGWSYYKKRDYDRAIADYQKALKISPNMGHTKNNLALAIKDKNNQ